MLAFGSKSPANHGFELWVTWIRSYMSNFFYLNNLGTSTSTAISIGYTGFMYLLSYVRIFYVTIQFCCICMCVCVCVHVCIEIMSHTVFIIVCYFFLASNFHWNECVCLKNFFCFNIVRFAQQTSEWIKHASPGLDDRFDLCRARDLFLPLPC